jgi:dienelactone hydrolase
MNANRLERATGGLTGVSGWWATLPFAAAIFALALLPATLTGQPTIHVSPDEPLIDEALDLSVTGLRPGDTVLLRMSALSQIGAWASSAEFEAGSDGGVDLTVDAPVDGSYQRADGMGLFWSAVPDSAAPANPSGPANAQTVRISAIVGDAVVAETSFIRHVVRPGVQAIPVRTDALIGTFFLPSPSTAPGPYPALLALGGSECGLRSAEAKAAALASHGFAALALAYCSWPDRNGNPVAGMEELPQGLWLVPLANVERGLTWLTGRSEVDPSRLGVWGGSKGAELALLIASSNPQVKAVVAYVPSHVVWQGLDFRGGQKSSWSRDGDPMPYVRFTDDESRIRKYTGGRTRYITHLYRASLDDSSAVAAARIPVERINGPVLLVSAGNDLLWPSAYMAQQIVDRLEREAHPHPVTHLSYPGAGHAIGRPFRPTTGLSTTPNFALGGTPAEYAAAERDSWPRVLRFLRESL